MAPGSRSSSISADDGERLEALGYVQSGTRLVSPEEYGPADDPKNWIELAEMLDEAVSHHRAERPAEAIALL